MSDTGEAQLRQPRRSACSAGRNSAVVSTELRVGRCVPAHGYSSPSNTPYLAATPRRLWLSTHVRSARLRDTNKWAAPIPRRACLATPQHSSVWSSPAATRMPSAMARVATPVATSTTVHVKARFRVPPQRAPRGWVLRRQLPFSIRRPDALRTLHEVKPHRSRSGGPCVEFDGLCAVTAVHSVSARRVPVLLAWSDYSAQMRLRSPPPSSGHSRRCAKAETMGSVR